ncbi:hypothetical protein D3C72_1988290 [compost metagenome]
MNGDLDRNMNFNDYFTFEAVDRQQAYFLFNEVMFSVYPTFHVKNKKSYGLIIGEKDYVIYTADSLVNKDLIELAVQDGCSAIFHDCQFIHTKNRVHASLEDLISLDAHLKELIHIMHYGDDLNDYQDQVLASGLHIAFRNNPYSFTV